MSDVNKRLAALEQRIKRAAGASPIERIEWIEVYNLDEPRELIGTRNGVHKYWNPENGDWQDEPYERDQ